MNATTFLVLAPLPARMSTTVAVLTFDGADELDVVGPFEVLAAAADRGCALDVSLRTPTPTDRVTLAHGMKQVPDGALGDPDLCVVPGGGWSTGAADGVRGQLDGPLPDRLASLHESGTAVVSVCTGALLLAEAGLLDGRRATTHRAAREDLRDRGVEVVSDRVVADGDVVTAGGVTAGLDLGLHLVARYCGSDARDAVATALEYG